MSRRRGTQTAISTRFAPIMDASDVLVERLLAWGVETIFGIPGDGIAVYNKRVMGGVRASEIESGVLEVQNFGSGCSEMLKVFPSGSLNHATFAPVGDVQIPNSS